MKLSTGLRPRVQPSIKYPGMDRESFSVMMDDAAVVVPTLRAVEVWPVTFETFVDTPERPAGAIMSVIQVTSFPKVTQRSLEFTIPDEARGRMDEWIDGELQREGVPIDAIVTNHRHDATRTTRRSILWWEVEA